jgi:hypothetical protein
MGDVEHANHLDILARSNASRAENAEAHVMPDHRVARALVTAPQRKFVTLNRAGLDTVPDYVFLELVPRLRAAAVLQVVSRITFEQEFQHAAACPHHGLGFGFDDHSLRYRCGTGREQLRFSLDRHDAYPTVADVRQLGIPTERRDVDACLLCGLEYRHPMGCFDASTVDVESRHG